jgi:hypothetical protein
LDRGLDIWMIHNIGMSQSHRHLQCLLIFECPLTSWPYGPVTFGHAEETIEVTGSIFTPSFDFPRVCFSIGRKWANITNLTGLTRFCEEFGFDQFLVKLWKFCPQSQHSQGQHIVRPFAEMWSSQFRSTFFVNSRATFRWCMHSKAFCKRQQDQNRGDGMGIKSLDWKSGKKTALSRRAAPWRVLFSRCRIRTTSRRIDSRWRRKWSNWQAPVIPNTIHIL